VKSIDIQFVSKDVGLVTAPGREDIASACGEKRIVHSLIIIERREAGASIRNIKSWVGEYPKT
jgi:hypothetical protein